MAGQVIGMGREGRVSRIARFRWANAVLARSKPFHWNHGSYQFSGHGLPWLAGQMRLAAAP